MEKKKYWEFKAKADDSTEADLYLYVEIASWGDGYYAHSAQSFKTELDALGNIKVLNVYINSPGGSVFEGNSIYNMLKRKSRECEINMYVDGMAASIASVILMVGTNISMPKNAMVMIHKAKGGCYGDEEEHRQCADFIEKINDNMKQVYLDRSNGKLDEATLDFWLSNGDTWLSAQDCLDYGLCDEITEEIQLVAKYDMKVLKQYHNIPKDFLNLKKQIKEPENDGKAYMDKETRDLYERVNNKAKTWNL
ncbi:head maturation protease, ClpP-related [uncultured Clostridium sp.]|uniref:head maturation protease, ClpP-related n=1 Tax=uncultured Clostridium sp. TaxID=59620 RepID=UPI0025E3CB67|nr:head maturation protease, ClpP-related [uncultured Clostridium sp.]